MEKHSRQLLKRIPGLSEKQTLENLIMKITGLARRDAGEVVEQSFGKKNHSIVMSRIGSRGSILNVIQMSALVAQHSKNAKHITLEFKKFYYLSK